MADLIDREELLCALYQDCHCMNTRFLNCVRQAPAVNRWIPVSERLPEKDTSVLIYAAGHRVTAYYDAVNDVFRLTESNDLFYRKSAVTHWMPLPETPEETPDGGAEK